MDLDAETYLNNSELNGSLTAQQVDGEEKASIDGITKQSRPSRLSCITDDDLPLLFFPTEKRQRRRIEELSERVKELEERSAQATEEAQKEKNKASKYEAALKCVVCEDVICNPHSLQCGHSACYSCLRTYWTKATDGASSAFIISTDEEEGNDDDDKPHIVRRRYRFASVIHRRKSCPSCQKTIIRRPVPDYTLRNMSEITETHLPRIFKHSNSTHRKDAWHGIFPPERDTILVQNGTDTNPDNSSSSQVYTPEEVFHVGRLAQVVIARVRLRVENAQEQERRLTAVLEGLERERNRDPTVIDPLSPPPPSRVPTPSP